MRPLIALSSSVRVAARTTPDRLLLRPLLLAHLNTARTTTAERPAPPPPPVMATISDAIIKDHRELEHYYSEVVNSKDLDHQQRYGNQFTWELARHAVGEELVVYPQFERFLGEKGRVMAEHNRKEHHRTKVQLKEFQGMKSSDPNYVPKLNDLWAGLSKHIEGEEKNDLPTLESAIGHIEGESRSMARNFGRTKWFVPSRSHPSAGEQPPFETVMGLLTAPFDHVADMFRKFPDRTIPLDPSAKQDW